MYYFMDIFYALGMNLTKKTTVKFGQTDDVEKAYKKFDEVVALVQQAVKEPEHTGNYFDYVELCKLYDKNENGTMMLAELETFLSLMGKFFGPTNLTQKFSYQIFIKMTPLKKRENISSVKRESRSIQYCFSFSICY